MIVLDTHAWIWWLSSPEHLSAAARNALDEATETQAVRVSTMSTWEMAMLVSRGRLELRIPLSRWIAKSESLPFLGFVPPGNAILLRAVAFQDPFPRDPADRIIAATAQHLACPLVTKDSRLRAERSLSVVW